MINQILLILVFFAMWNSPQLIVDSTSTKPCKIASEYNPFALDNHADQLNPNNEAYCSSRGK